MDRLAYTAMVFMMLGSHRGFAAANDNVPMPSTSPKTQTINPPSEQSIVDCSQLPAEELIFSGQIMDPPMKKAFCSDLTSEERQQVMMMTRTADPSGKIMTADEAMQKFMQNRPASSPSSKSKSGSCPLMKENSSDS